MICRASHSAVGCRVTSHHNSCRRPWPRTETQTSDQRSTSAQRTYRLRQSPQRDFEETSSRFATVASKVAPYISRPSIGPPQSPGLEARRGFPYAPHSGFSLRIRWIRSRTPRSIFGRPALFLDFQRQKTLKPARCQRRMVSGCTTWTVPIRLGQSRVIHMSNARSPPRSRKRGGARRKAMAS